MSRVLVLVNPAAGGGRAWAIWERARRAVSAARKVEAVCPAGAEASRAAVAEAVAAGVERIVAFGGDGTVHLVAGALLAAGVADRVILGVVPAGTGSDLARALAIPRHVSQALDRALVGPPVPVDAGRCCGERASFFFLNETSAGIAGLVDETVNAIPRRGTTAFVVATLRALRRYRPLPMRVEVDGEPWHEGSTFLVTVANGTSFGKGMRIAPRARVDDGLFDVVVVGNVQGLELVRRLPQVYLGTHLSARPVKVRRGREVRLEPLAPLPAFDADGETYPSGAATFSLLPAALKVASARA